MVWVVENYNGSTQVFFEDPGVPSIQLESLPEGEGPLRVVNGEVVRSPISLPPDPPAPSVEEDPYAEMAKALREENKLLRAQLQASVDRSEFIEDCIAEMATVVYGGV